MNVRVELIRPIESLKQGMFTTMNEFKDIENIKLDGDARDKTMMGLLLGRHSPMNRAIFRVTATVPKRCHEHLRTHRDIQHVYFCGTSRTDIHYHTTSEDERNIEFDLSPNALIHIASRRLCPSAHSDVRKFTNILVDNCTNIFEELRFFAVKPCVHTGICTEPRTNCGYMTTADYIERRSNLIEISEMMKCQKK
jgi:hypothetical protein